MDGPELDLRLLVDHRERLVRHRVELNSTLLWHLHDLWPELRLPGGALFSKKWTTRIGRRLARAQQTMRVRIARDELRRLRELTQAINQLEREITALVGQIAPQLLSEPGFGPLTAAKLVGEIAGAQRFATPAKLARAAGVAPIPASSGNTRRQRLDRGGNRQINAALHRVIVTRARCHQPTRDYIARRRSEGKSTREAIRCLKTYLARRVWRLLQPPTRSRRSYPHQFLDIEATHASVWARLTQALAADDQRKRVCRSARSVGVKDADAHLRAWDRGWRRFIAISFKSQGVRQMIANNITSAREDALAIGPARRFSEGMERLPLSPSTLRVGRFSDGAAPSLTVSPDQLGSFADGLVARPDPSAPRRVGSFGDGYGAIAGPRSSRLRGPTAPAPAQA